MKGSEGLPIGVQICGLPFEEEKVLCIMKEIDEKTKFIDNFGLPKLNFDIKHIERENIPV